MSFQFPHFTQPDPLDGTRAWTATFDSYDQRNDDAYYVVTLHDGGKATASFMVSVAMYWAGDDWSGPDFARKLRDELARVAQAGKTNTSYTGALTPGPHRS